MVLALYWLLYVLAVATINMASVFVQCGVGQCHTMGYALLGYPGNEARQTVFTACHPFFTHFKMAACLRLLASKML